MKRVTLIECTLTDFQNMSESTLEVTSVTLTMKTRFDCWRTCVNDMERGLDCWRTCVNDMERGFDCWRTCVNDMERGFVEHLVDPENLKVGCEDTYSIQ